MRGCQCGCEGEGLFGLAEEDAEGGGFAGEGGGERGGIGDFGDIGAAGLLGAFEGDAAPAFGALGGGEGEVLLGAAGKDGRDSGDAQFGGFLDGPLEAVELEDGEEKVDGEGCVGFQLFVEGEEDFDSWSLLAAARSSVTSARWRKPLATTSKSWPGWARRTRARWTACSPVRAAWVGWPD